ncbi:MAG: ATP-binding cassette domain-containing protein [Acidimicrobiia bacterium]|nr:MAG: ATP-binding cassette domain-containing protein [Acidimicrobiia bacterium]
MVMRTGDLDVHRSTVARLEDVEWSRFDQVALRGITLGLGRNERVAVSGPEGSGKTTLLRLLGALSIPTSGSVVVLGVRTDGVPSPALLDLRSRIGFIHQTFHHSPHVTVAEVIEHATAGTDHGQTQGRVAAWLGRVGMEHRGDERFADLDVEERLRVVIGRTMASRPDLVLADDPARELTGIARRQVNRLLFDLCEEKGLTLVSAVRDIDSVPGSATRLVGLSDGAVVLDEHL